MALLLKAVEQETNKYALSCHVHRRNLRLVVQVYLEGMKPVVVTAFLMSGA